MYISIYVAKTKALSICASVFAYAKSRVSHDVTHVILRTFEFSDFIFLLSRLTCL